MLSSLPQSMDWTELTQLLWYVGSDRNIDS
jgi:hypothetical protein